MPSTKKRKPANSEDAPKSKKRMPLMRDWQRPDPTPRPVPKLETQELYNQWQDIERFPEGLALLEEQGIHENEFLTSPISPTRTSSVRSRSPSCASTTNSLRQALDDVEITKKKRRAIRTQPLSPRARAKAAFIRKLGACAHCHRRRVGCHRNHYDLSLFEAQYRISRNLEPLESENNGEESRAGLGAVDQEQTAADIPPFRFSLGHSNDLIGVGQNLNESYPTGIQDDPDGLLQPTNLPPTRNPFSSVSGSSQAPFFRPGNTGLVNNIDYTRPSMTQFPIYPPLSGSGSAIPRSLASPAAEPRHLPIGKQLRQDRDEWECLHGTSEVDASVSSGSTGACSQHCSSLLELRQHYFYQHSPFESANFMWRCISCGFNSPDLFDNVADPNESCLQCGKRNHQQRWYWGLVRKEFDLLSGRRAIQVSSQEPSTTKSAPPPSYSQNSSSGGGHNFPGVFTFTGYTNSSGSSGQYWKAASKANYMMRYVTIRPCDALAEKASPSSTPAVLLCPSKLPLLGPGFSVFAMLSLASICVVEVWLWLSAKPSPGFQSRTGFSFLDLALSVVPELSLACVAAGVIGTWLFRHVRLRWAGQEHFEALLHDDGYYIHNPLNKPKQGEVLGQSPWAANAA